MDSPFSGGREGRRTLQALFYNVDPVDQSDLQQKCLDIVRAGVFTVIDFGAYTELQSLADSFPQHALPLLSGRFIPEKQKDQFYPYIFGFSAAEVLYRNSVFALNQRAFFSATDGFRKLGWVYRDCEPEYIFRVSGMASPDWAIR